MRIVPIRVTIFVTNLSRGEQARRSYTYVCPQLHRFLVQGFIILLVYMQ